MKKIQTRTTEFEKKKRILCSKPRFLQDLKKVIYVQNLLPTSFGTALVCNKILKVRNSPNLHIIITH